jgi:hypothetical protein
MKWWRVDWHTDERTDDVLSGTDTVQAYDECDAYRETVRIVRARHGDVSVVCKRAVLTHHESWKDGILP